MSVLRALLAAAALLSAVGEAHAQTTQEAIAPQPLSEGCRTPGLTLSEVSLPAIARALKERKVIKILTMGASSSPLMRQPNERYVSDIESILEKTIPGVDVQIVDHGISGEIARDVVERVKTEVALNEPDLVLLQVGGSDAIAHTPVGEFETDVNEIIGWLKGHGVDIAVVGMSYIGTLKLDPHYQALRKALQRVAAQQNVLLIGRYDAMQLLSQAKAAGQEHTANEFTVTEKGYECLSEYVVRAITSGIVIKGSKAKPERGK